MPRLVITGAVTPEEIPGLCERVRRLLRPAGAGPVVCDVGGLGPMDLCTVDALARMQLEACRRGGSIRVDGADDHLRELLSLVGIAGLFLPEAELPVEARGEAEQREPPRGVQEEHDPRDPPV